MSKLVLFGCFFGNFNCFRTVLGCLCRNLTYLVVFLNLQHVRFGITRLCFFFNAICSKIVDRDRLDELQDEIVMVLCQLEMYFPPTFFDIMVHLVVHLVREIKICGPVYLHWMYPFERYMKVFKGYVKNRYRPDASIVERYIAEEVIEFCTGYLCDTNAIGLPKSRHEGRMKGKGTSVAKLCTPLNDELQNAHLYILRNSEEVVPYVTAHMSQIRKCNRGWTDKDVLNEHNRTFVNWFSSTIDEGETVSETLRWLAYKPNHVVLSYLGYDINGFSFAIKSQDDQSTTQNSGVTLVSEALHVASSKDKNPVYANMSYYGVIEEIWELDYVKFKVPVFKCKWVENNNGVRIDELGFTLVDLNREGFKGEPFILASQAKQVFYVTDPCDKKWSVVLQGKKQNIGFEIDNDVSNEVPPFSLGVPPVRPIEEDRNMDEFILRTDHVEGIWVDDPFSKKRKTTS